MNAHRQELAQMFVEYVSNLNNAPWIPPHTEQDDEEKRDVVHAIDLFTYKDRLSYLAMRELDKFYQQAPEDAPCQSEPMDQALYAIILSTLRMEAALDIIDPGM